MRQASIKHPRGTNVSHRPADPPPVEVIDTQEDADTPFAEGASDSLDPDLRHRMISEAAYHLHAQRGYMDGYELDDWLQAEAQVDHVSLKRESNGPLDDAAGEREPT